MGLRIVIIEDEFELAENVADYLTHEGHEVTEIITTKKQYEETKRRKPIDLFLIDILLNGKKEGLELARLAHTENPNSGIIYITALTNTEILTEISETIYDSYLQKPFSLKSLASSIFLVSRKFQKFTENGTIRLKRNLLSIKENGNTIVLDEDNILFIKAEGLCSIVSLGSKEYKARELLKVFFFKLDHNDFYRVHKSYIINIRKIETINYKFCIIGSETIPLKRGIYKELLSKINKLPISNKENKMMNLS